MTTAILPEPVECPITWRTKDGRSLKPREMTTGHVVNALKMLKRKLQRQKIADYDVNLSATYGGMSGMSEAAQDAMSWQAQTLEVEHWKKGAPPIVGVFIQVLRDRNCTELDEILES
jgi:hypothetical protein